MQIKYRITYVLAYSIMNKKKDVLDLCLSLKNIVTKCCFPCLKIIPSVPIGFSTSVSFGHNVTLPHGVAF